MIPDSARTTDAAALALEYGESVVLESIRRTHARVAYRAFGATRLVGSRGPQKIHDAISNTVYGAISGGLKAGSLVARELATRGVGAPIDTSTTGRRIRAAVNGLVGEQLRLASDPQAIVMTIRKNGNDIPASAWWLSQAFPTASDHLVVFVHGLCESDEVWSAESESIANVVDTQTEATSLLIRYNTGLKPTENGTHLSAMLAQVMLTWPVAVGRLTLVGHGMGGLVIRSAINHAQTTGLDWPTRTRDIVFLGVPQAGQFVEKTQQATLQMMPRVMRPRITHGVPGSSALCRAIVNAEEWTNHDVTGRWGSNRLAVGPLPWANHHYLVCEWSLNFGAAMGQELRHQQATSYIVAAVSATTRVAPALNASETTWENT